MSVLNTKTHSDLSVSLLLVALASGLLLPELLSPLQVWSTLLLQIIFFLTSLRIELRGLWQEFRDVRSMMIVTTFMLIILPLLAYVSMRPLGEDLALALFLLAAMPVGMTTPLLAQLLGLNVPLALVFTLSTSLLLPVTLPLLLGWLLPQSIVIDLSHLFVTLLQVILFPFLLAQLVRRFLPSIVERATVATKKLALFSMCLLMAGIAARYHEELVGGFSLEYLFGLLVLTGFFIIVHVLSFWLLWWRSVPDRMTVVLSVVYMNFTLAIYIAQQFFPDPEILLYTILSIIPWNIGMLLFRQILGRQKNTFIQSV